MIAVNLALQLLIKTRPLLAPTKHQGGDQNAKFLALNRK